MMRAHPAHAILRTHWFLVWKCCKMYARTAVWSRPLNLAYILDKCQMQRHGKTGKQNHAGHMASLAIPPALPSLLCFNRSVIVIKSLGASQMICLWFLQLGNYIFHIVFKITLKYVYTSHVIVSAPTLPLPPPTFSGGRLGLSSVVRYESKWTINLLIL